MPLKAWIKNALDHVIQSCMNEPGLEFVWVGDDAIDPLQQAQTLQILVSTGLKTREEARAERGSAHSVTSAKATESSAIPSLRTKREHFLDRLRRSWHSQLQWENGAGGDGAAASRSGFPEHILPPSPLGPERVPALASPGARMSALDLFLPLLKVDLDRRLVSGVATAETPDRAGEIFDYASSKPYFEQWSADALAASGGKSFGAVRAMHGNVAAGKLTDIAFDDDAKRITVAAKIVDDDEWRKVQEGVYTGFSQGGRYVKRWPDTDTGLTRYTAEPHEISLVDLPCVRDATFEVIKNGVVEKRAFAARPEAAAPGQESDAVTAPIDQTLDAIDAAFGAEKREFSAAEREKDAEAGVAMPDGSYPIESADDVENAVRDYNRSGQKPDVKAPHHCARESDRR